MSIGFSDGTTAEDWSKFYLGSASEMPARAPEKAAGAFKSNSGTQVPSDVMSNEDEYDYTSAKADGAKQSENGHWPDTYKLPGHMTFSDESMYNDGGAGHWENANDHWYFTPGPTNLKHHSMDEMRDYFKSREPDSTLVDPKIASLGMNPKPSEVMANSEMSDEDDASQELHDGNATLQRWQEQQKKPKDQYDPNNVLSPPDDSGVPDDRGIHHPGVKDGYGWKMQVDNQHHVPLVATALTTDGQNMYGMAVDHRVDTQMDFDGKKHDITPFLYAHEQAELGPMHDLIKGGMDVQSAYHEAHDKAANPSEAAARFTYAAKNGLDSDEFNKAYYVHIQQATKVAQQSSEKTVHPNAHTTRYGLDSIELPEIVIKPPTQNEGNTEGKDITSKYTSGGDLGMLSHDELFKALKDADDANNEDESIRVRDEMFRREDIPLYSGSHDDTGVKMNKWLQKLRIR